MGRRKRHAEQGKTPKPGHVQSRDTLNDPGDGSKHSWTPHEGVGPLSATLNTAPEHARAVPQLRGAVRAAIAELPRAPLSLERLPGELGADGLVLTISVRPGDLALLGAVRRVRAGQLEPHAMMTIVESSDRFAHRLAEVLPMLCRVLAGDAFHAQLERMRGES